jgi:AraC-like DNA-binding protein
MFPKQLELGGDLETLADAYGRFIPGATVVRARDWKLFRWKGHLSIAEGRSLWQVRANRDLTTQSAGESGFFALAIPEDGGICTSVRGREVLAAPGQAVLLHVPERRKLHALCRGAHARTSLKWLSTEWESTLASMFDDEPLAQLDVNALLDLSDERGQVLSRLISAVAHDIVDPVHQSSLASVLMNEALLRLVFEKAMGHKNHRSRETMPRHVRLAIDFMNANAAKPIYIRDVAAACGVTARSLETGFREAIDMTPLAYLRQIRLDAARKELQAGFGSHKVGDVARRWGFVDLGRFSARYRQAFGELPSETRRRR